MLNVQATGVDQGIHWSRGFVKVFEELVKWTSGFLNLLIHQNVLSSTYVRAWNSWSLKVLKCNFLLLECSFNNFLILNIGRSRGRTRRTPQGSRFFRFDIQVFWNALGVHAPYKVHAPLQEILDSTVKWLHTVWNFFSETKFLACKSISLLLFLAWKKCAKYRPKISTCFVWMSGFQKSLIHQDFDMFVDEWSCVNENPGWVQMALRADTLHIIY